VEPGLVTEQYPSRLPVAGSASRRLFWAAPLFLSASDRWVSPPKKGQGATCLLNAHISSANRAGAGKPCLRRPPLGPSAPRCNIDVAIALGDDSLPNLPGIFPSSAPSETHTPEQRRVSSGRYLFGHHDGGAARGPRSSRELVDGPESPPRRSGPPAQLHHLVARRPLVRLPRLAPVLQVPARPRPLVGRLCPSSRLGAPSLSYRPLLAGLTSSRRSLSPSPAP